MPGLRARRRLAAPLAILILASCHQGGATIQAPAPLAGAEQVNGRGAAKLPPGTARRLLAAPANDMIANATAISGIPFTTPVDTTEATADPTDPYPFSPSGHNVWFTYTPTTTGRIAARTSKPALLTAFGGPIGAQTELVPTTYGNYVGIDAVAGVPIYIVAEPDTSEAMAFDFGLELPPAAPPNDDIANATPIAAFPFDASQDTGESTSQPEDPFWRRQGTVWYTIMAPAAGRVIVDASSSDYIPVVRAFSGSPGALIELRADHNKVGFDVTAGATYYVMLEGRGHLTLGVNATPAPANDDVAAATPITALPFHATLDVSGATKAASDPVPACFVGEALGSTWFRYEATSDANLLVDAAASDHPARIVAFTGSPGVLEEVGCESGPAQVLRTEPGKTYYLMVVRESGDGPANLALDVSTVPAVPNDLIANATPIGAIPFSATQDTRYATLSSGDPRDFFTPWRASVWYRYDAAATLPLIANTHGSDYDTVLAAVERHTDGTLTTLNINDNDEANGLVQSRLGFDATAGRTYYLMAASVGSVFGGNLTLNLRERLIPKPVATVDPIAYLDPRTNMVRVSGRVSSVNPASGSLSVDVQQRVGRGEITGSNFTPTLAGVGPEGVTWTIDVPSAGKWAGGTATVMLHGAFQNEDDQAFLTFTPTTIRVVGKR